MLVIFIGKSLEFIEGIWAFSKK